MCVYLRREDNEILLKCHAELHTHAAVVCYEIIEQEIHLKLISFCEVHK